MKGMFIKLFVAASLIAAVPGISAMEKFGSTVATKAIKTKSYFWDHPLTSFGGFSSAVLGACTAPVAYAKKALSQVKNGVQAVNNSLQKHPFLSGFAATVMLGVTFHQKYPQALANLRTRLTAWLNPVQPRTEGVNPQEEVIFHPSIHPYNSYSMLPEVTI